MSEKVVHQSQTRPLEHCHRLQLSIGISIKEKIASWLVTIDMRVDPLMVRLEAMQPEKLQSVNLANSLETTVRPAEHVDEPLNELELQI